MAEKRPLILPAQLSGAQTFLSAGPSPATTTWSPPAPTCDLHISYHVERFGSNDFTVAVDIDELPHPRDRAPELLAVQALDDLRTGRPETEDAATVRHRVERHRRHRDIR